MPHGEKDFPIKFEWNANSDQPHRLKDKAARRRMRLKVWPDHLKLVLANLCIWPLVPLSYFCLKPTVSRADDFFGLGVNIEWEPDRAVDLVHELGVDHLLIRFPLYQLDQVEKYLAFVKRFRHRKIILSLPQSRAFVGRPQELEVVLSMVFRKFEPWVEAFQIGHAVNRTKWGFFSIDEYLHFYKTAYQLKKKQFQHVTMIGPSIIDFEYYNTLRALFHFFPIRFDQVSSLLYVDRRGAPESRQMGLDLVGKIKLLASLVSLSPRAGKEILITETNWPIAGTYPYAPTSGKECVDEETYTNYMVRYYLLALATGYVKTVYWHQLIAPGYGLIDNRDGIRKREAYQAFKTMLQLLKGSRLETFKKNGAHYALSFRKGEEEIEAHWSLRPKVIPVDNYRVISICGKEVPSRNIELGERVVYLVRSKNASSPSGDVRIQ